VIHPYDRIYWDIFVFLVIMASAFEIPYDWLVGWTDEATSLIFDTVFFAVFLADMVLNSFTMRERTFSGLWGFRNITGLFVPETSPERRRRGALERNPRMVMVLDQNPSIFLDYARSGWFPVDFLSMIPWGVIAVSFSPLNSLRLLRLLRLARLFRVLRLTKAIFILEKIRRSVPSIPSVERLLFIAMSIPWIAHVLACLYYYFETAEGGTGVRYGSAFHSMWMAIMARRTTLEPVSDPSFYLGMGAILISVFVIAAVTGNLAAMYTSLDFGKTENQHVVLENHAIIIGWSNSAFSVIEQLLAAEQQGGAKNIVLLSKLSEAEVWREIDEFGLTVGPRRLTVHTGSVQSVHNIRKLSVGRAQNVIVLGGGAPGGDGEQAMFYRMDTTVLKSLLACCNAFSLDEWARVSRRQHGYLSIVAAVHSREMATMLQQGIPRRGAEHQYLDIHIVDTEDVLSRCMAQVAVEPILSEVFGEIFSYTRSGTALKGDSNEIYIVGIEELTDPYGLPVSLVRLGGQLGVAGLRFREAAVAMPESVPIGFFSGENIIPDALRELYPQECRTSVGRGAGSPRHLFLNPGVRSNRHGERVDVPFESEHLLRRGDALVVIAHSYEKAKIIDPRRVHIVPPASGELEDVSVTRQPRRVVVLGRGGKANKVLSLLPDYLPPRSTVVAEVDVTLDPRARRMVEERDVSFERMSLSGVGELGGSVESAELDEFDTVVVRSDDEQLQAHDANILMALTALESRQRTSTAHSTGERTHVVELLDAHNVELAEAFGHVSYLISSELVSSYLVQIANNPERGMVYSELLDLEGNEFYVVPLRRYLQSASEDVSFAELAERAVRLGEVAVGYAYSIGEPRRRLRLCPTGPHRFKTRRVLASAHAETIERLVVIAARFPGG